MNHGEHPDDTATDDGQGPPRAALSAGDTFLSLNGWDEIAVAHHFKTKVQQLRDDPTTMLRAMYFVDVRRLGVKDPEAYKIAMGKSINEVRDYFPDDEDELDPDDPETEAGKDG